MGFGAHYLAHPTLTLRPDATLLDIGLATESRSGKPMKLMYMCHISFAFMADGRPGRIPRISRAASHGTVTGPVRGPPGHRVHGSGSG